MLALASVIVLPLALKGNTWGHDIEFHLSSWMEAARSFREGVPFPRWAGLANYGFGEPRFIFYPPVSRLIGAALGLVLPWRTVPGAFVWLAIVVAGSSMFCLARSWLSTSEATGIALLFAINPYLLIDAFLRNAYAELLASAVFPLVLHYGLRLERERSKAFLPLALVIALVWLTNLPAGVIVTYSLLLVIGVVAAVSRSFMTSVYGVAALLLGLLVSSFHLLPAEFEQRYVSIASALAPILSPESNFLFGRSADEEFRLFLALVLKISAAEILAFIAIVALSARHRRLLREAWWAMTALMVCSIALMFHLSVYAWRFLPELRFVQFPWRWLSPLNVGGTFIAGFVIVRSRCRKAGWVLVVAGFLLADIYILRQATWDSSVISELQSAIRLNRGYEGVDEYTPIDCEQNALPRHAPLVVVKRDTNGGATSVEVEQWANEFKAIRVDSLQPATLALRLLNYPGWQATVNGRPVPTESEEPTGAMMIKVPGGRSQVQVAFRRTLDRTIGAAISFAGVIVLFLLAPTRLSMGKRFYGETSQGPHEDLTGQR
jgi:hypothetical protein